MNDPRNVLATAIREAPWFDQSTPGETADLCLAALSDAGFVIVPREDLRATLNELDMLCDGPGDDEPNTARLRAVLEGGENAVIRDEWPKPAKDPCYDRNGSRYCTRPKGHEGDHRWDYEPEGCPVLEGGEPEREKPIEDFRVTCIRGRTDAGTPVLVTVEEVSERELEGGENE